MRPNEWDALDRFGGGGRKGGWGKPCKFKDKILVHGLFPFVVNEEAVRKHT